MKKILAGILLSCMVFSLAACGAGTDKNSQAQNSQKPQNSQVQDSQKDTQAEDDNKVVYKVTVVDADGNPMSGVMVQICKDSCIPKLTNAEGVAEFEVADEEGYKISFSSIPEGYESESDETEFYFEDGKSEMTLTLKKVQ